MKFFNRLIIHLHKKKAYKKFRHTKILGDGGGGALTRESLSTPPPPLLALPTTFSH